MSEASLSITNSKRTRTFTGCLTCRRRKVKCPGPALPCRACSRLQLECRSPFSKNLRSSNIASRQLVPTKATAVSHNQCHYTQGLAPEPLSPCTSILGPSARSDVTTGLPAVIPDVVSPDEWAATAQQWDDSRHALLDQSLFFDPLAPPRDAQNVFTFPSPGNLPNSQESWALDQADFVLDERYTTETDSSDSNRQALSLGMPLDICLPDESAPALVYFKGHLTTLLSVKNAQWNIFAHFLGRQHRKSPIGSSIIALAAAHQGLTLQNVSNEYLTHYGQASADLEHLLTSFESTGQIPPEHLEMVLATIYFLSHCEIVACDTFKIASRLKRIGALISAQWPSLRSTLTGISARLLLWLAYLDVRVSVLQDRAEIGSEPLLSTISRLNGLPRLYLSSRLYLKEAFGRHYPSSELQHDMVHDPVNMKYAEAMDTLGRVIRYARGVSDETHHSMLNRTTELEDLHSKLLDLEEVSIYVLSDLPNINMFRNAILLCKGSILMAQS